MFFIRLNFVKFKEVVKCLCFEDEYMVWSDDQIYRFMDYVEKLMLIKLEADIPLKWSAFLQECFHEFIFE
jgi:hypothetical protein